MPRFLRLAIGVIAAIAVISGCDLFRKYELTVSISPPEAGTVTPADGEHPAGRTVELTATAGAGFTFVGFNGGVEDEDGWTVVMDGDKALTAVFSVDGVDLTIDPEEGGQVLIELAPASKGYLEGQMLQLTAQPAEGWTFIEWGGDLEGTANPEQREVTGLLAVTAVFDQVTVELDRDNAYSGVGSEGYLVDTSGSTLLTYTLDLGTAVRDVFFIFTNTGLADEDEAPTVTEVSGSFGMAPPPPQPRVVSGGSGSPPNPVAIRGLPAADAFYAESEQLLRDAPASRTPAPPMSKGIGATNTFYYDSSTVDTIPATCRAAKSEGATTLYIWVADDQWHAGGGDVTLEMVDEVAAVFLSGDGAGDIHEWITTIYGQEWGAVPPEYTNLIPSDGSVHILFYDIEADGTAFVEDGGIVGFFWAKDNFLRGGGLTDASNERIMFYMDAPMLAQAQGTWEITDFWPQEIVSTLGHEFQHMIHYYQKTILRAGGMGTATWLNEMCSMVAEDLIADKLQVPGPRGVSFGAFPLGSAGDPDNPEGFLPRYNYYNETSVAYWPAGSTATFDDYLNSYATNYAFGAYLARNFGGAELFQKIVQSEFTDEEAVTIALAGLGHEEDFALALRKWGVANLLSDDTTADVGVRYNSGGFFASTVGTGTYNLGSVNLFNYRFIDDSIDRIGPMVWTLQGLAGVYGTSNSYYVAAQDVSGELVWQILLETNIRLNVVVRE